MKRMLFLTKLGLGVLIATFTNGCVGNIPGQVNAEPPISNLKTDIGQATEPAEKAPGIIVHIDPNTGQIITPPTGTLPGQITQPPVGAAKQPLPELHETLSPVPGGGVMIHLDDRFHTPLTATIDADGKVRLEHKPSMSGSND